MALEPGQVVRVRSRQYLVEEVVQPPQPTDDTLVRLSCLDDDAQGEPLEVLWESEVDAQVVNEANWRRVADHGFDPPKLFAAYLHTLRWNCVTATDPRLLQAPYRAGIEVMAYQLEPLRKALLLPRVNVFIADDVGLGKTIEAGLILRELLMRQKVRRVVVACPPSVVNQWRDELDSRFGLPMVVFDRDYVIKCRRERGYGVNPWATHSRFIVSHALLRDEAYSDPLRAWLGEAEPCPGSLLILDEAHNAAPASSSKYAIDSKLTIQVRELAPKFEHKLFLSATPHNGHSNSFSALLEILDPQRFCRGVPIRGEKQTSAVMVRRLKSDLREVNASDFPTRNVIQVDIDGLPEDAPELVLAQLLEEYRQVREDRLENAKASKKAQAAAQLVIINLQKRLLSSIDAFAFTLRVHRASMERKRSGEANADLADLALLQQAPGADDPGADLSPEELAAEETSQLELATEASNVGPSDSALAKRERALLEQMSQLAEAHRNQADAKTRELVAWIRKNCCPGKPGTWNERRVLIFTEYVDTMRYLERQLAEALAGTDRAEERIATFHGVGSDERREELKRAFNSDPAKHPLRILIATDAAREGVNLQNHCADLFHFDVPWNPSRMEQRNGRIDRKLQRSPEVRCHYFVLKQRPEDRVLQVLVRKADTIQRELGSLSQVVEGRLAKTLSGGLRRRDLDRLARQIESEGPGQDRKVAEEELEAARERQGKLAEQLEALRSMLKRSQEHLGLEEHHFHNAIDQSLALLHAPALKPLGKGDEAKGQWIFPDLSARKGADASWTETLDTLRKPKPRELKLWDWRRSFAPRPVVFRDVGSLDDETVHLHLEHRVVQRLLGRFLAQGFVHNDLSRATVVLSDDPVPRVVLLGRLSLHGHHAARLHDEIVTVTAQWAAADSRKRPLKPYGETTEAATLRLLEQALRGPELGTPTDKQTRLLRESVERDVADLLPILDARAQEVAKVARAALQTRAEKEAKEMAELLRAQEKRIKDELAKQPEQLSLDLNPEEKRQLESERKHQRDRLGALEKEKEAEPKRILATYEVRAARVEPVGIVYLWPVTG